MQPNQTKNGFEKWYAETIPHMDFGSHKEMFRFAYEAGHRDRALGEFREILEENQAIIDGLRDRLREAEKQLKWISDEYGL